MPAHCVDCGRKGTKSGTRIVSERTYKCTECAPDDDAEEFATINPDAMLSELSVKDFTAWFKNELGLDTLIQKKVENVTKEIKNEVEVLRKSVKTANEDIAKLKSKVDELSQDLTEVKNENKILKKSCENNLKYLVNHDRNMRRSNVMLLGLPEDEDLVIGEATVKGDDDKIHALFKFLKVETVVEMVSYSRLGTSEEGKLRAIKIELKNGDMAREIIKEAHNLKTLNKKIFFKPDKSVKEREEFQRLLKKKEECIISHPTADGQQDRVILEKGVLKVDGVEIDRYKSPQTIF